MPQRPKDAPPPLPRRVRYELQVGVGGRRIRVALPTFDVRRVATGANPPHPGSRTGGTGTPRKSFRCPDELWGAAMNVKDQRGHNWNGVLRGYTAAYVTGIPEEHRAALAAAVLRGEVPVFPDPLAELDDEDAP